MTSERDSIHSRVSKGSISPSFTTSILLGFSFSNSGICFSCSLFFFKEFSASKIKFSVFFGTSSNLDNFLLGLDILRSKSPFETLSPTFTSMFSTFPEKVDGISTLDLSLSIVTTGSFILIS